VALFEGGTAVLSDGDVSENQGSGLYALDASGSVSNCTVSANGRQNENGSYAGLWLERSAKPDAGPCKWEVKSCRIRESKPGCFGVVVTGPGGEAELLHCDIQQHGWSGITAAREARVTVRGGTIARNGQCGVLLEAKAVGSLVDGCGISGNHFFGVEVRGGARTTVRGCRIAENQSSGVRAAAASGSLEECDICSNGSADANGNQAGLWIQRGEKSDLAPCKWEVKNCRIRESKPGCFGVVVMGQGNEIELVHCDIHKHAWSGVYVAWEATGHIRGCRVCHNGGAGVLVEKKAVCSLGDGTMVAGNAQNGIEVREESQTTITDCRITLNGGPGVRIRSKSRGAVTNCDLRANDQATVIEDDSVALVKLENNKE
jgi:parallel beta-helix repeat protein